MLFRKHKSNDDEVSLEQLTKAFPNIIVTKTRTKRIKVSFTMPIIPQNPLKISLLHACASVDFPVKTYQASYGFVGTLCLAFYLSELSKGKFKLKSDITPTKTMVIIHSALTKIMNSKIVEGASEWELAHAVCTFVSEDVFKTYAAELFENYWLKTRSKSLFAYWEYIGRSHKTKSITDGHVKCGICLENDHGKGTAVELDCGHCICRHCLKSYATHMLEKDDVRKLCCPECPVDLLDDFGMMSSSDVFQLLFIEKRMSLEKLSLVFTSEQLKKYVRHYNQLTLDFFDTRFPLQAVQCPKCDCCFMKKSSLDKQVVCVTCDFRFCVLCKEPDGHPEGFDCPAELEIPKHELSKAYRGHTTAAEIENLEIKYGADNWRISLKVYTDTSDLEEQCLQGGQYRQCPTCRIFIHKSSGCNRIYCTGCRRNFCFKCGVSLVGMSNPYLHYSIKSDLCYKKLWEE